MWWTSAAAVVPQSGFVLPRRTTRPGTKDQYITALPVVGFKDRKLWLNAGSASPRTRVPLRQCIVTCATSAVATEPERKPTEEDHVKRLMKEIRDKNVVTIAQVAPAVRASIGEEFGLEPGTVVTGKLVSALRMLGFDYVFDVIAGADLTIMEEGTELLHRLRKHLTGSPAEAGDLPMMTSCCPGWIEFCEKCSPEMLPYISTAKSPHMMQGAVLKAFFSDVSGHSEDSMRVCSVMPCVKKQGEADRMPYRTKAGNRQVDHVLTTTRLAKLLKDENINLPDLPEGHFDSFMGYGTGASVLFGTTGGVMEAALRTVYDLAAPESAREMGRLEFEEVRGLDGIKEASIVIPANPTGPLGNTEPFELRVAVANGLGNAKKMLKQVLDGDLKYHFIEVMACIGGCSGGGGQPRTKSSDVLKARQQALYQLDKGETIRKSYLNPVIQGLYTEYLEKPGSKIAEELLHTEYQECGPYKYNMFRHEDVKGDEEKCDVEECDAEDI